MKSFQVYDSIADFRNDVVNSLMELEAENNLLLGLAERLATKTIKTPVFLAGRSTQGESYFLQTDPTRNLILSTGWTDRGIQDLSQFLKAKTAKLPGVVGPKPWAESFAKLWSGQPRRTMDQRIYKLDQLAQRPSTSGHFEQAGPADHDLVVNWAAEFHREALPAEEVGAQDFLALIKDKLEQGSFFLWKDQGQVVSWGGIAGETLRGARLGPIFTPPSLRGRGYASALTWELSFEVLKTKKFCFLYTDLTNATSNSIYQKIGYRPVLESEIWHLA
jgi:uncharacterized protein